MEPIRKINDEIAIAGQVAIDQMPDLAAEGFQTILNVRSPDEFGFLIDEQDAVEQLGLCYVNWPIEADRMTAATIQHLLYQLHELPRPILIHCDSALRSAAIALAHIATQQGISLEQTLEHSRRLGLLNGVEKLSSIP